MDKKGVSDPKTAAYDIELSGARFDPRKVVWPSAVKITFARYPGEEYLSRSGVPKRAEWGRARVRHTTPPDEEDIFTDTDELMQFLIAGLEHLREVGMEDAIVTVEYAREKQMNSVLRASQIANLYRAGVDLGITFYQVDE